MFFRKGGRNKITIVVLLVLGYGCGKKNIDPLAPVVVANQAQYLEANKEALLLAGPPLQKFGQNHPLDATDNIDIDHAIRLYRGILAYKPSDAAPYLTLGMCYQALGMDERAISAFKAYLIAGKALKGSAIVQSRTDTYWLLSKSYFDLHAYGEAADQAGKAIKLNPHIARYYAQRAAALLQEKNYIQAKKDAETALKLDPSNVRAKGVIGLLNMSKS